MWHTLDTLRQQSFERAATVLAGATIAATPALVYNVLAPEYQQSLAALLVVRASWLACWPCCATLTRLLPARAAPCTLPARVQAQGFGLSEMWRAPAAIMIRDVSPPNLGSTGSAVHLCVRNLIGGLGPLGAPLPGLMGC